MRLSGLSMAVVLLFSSAAFAQHSGGSAGGSSGGSGGFHGGGGASVGSSGGSSSHSSSSSSSSSHASGSSGAHGKSGTAGAGTAQLSSRIHGSSIASAQPAKRGFFSFLRHPFRRATPAPLDAEHRFCRNGNCKTCPPGQVSNGMGGCMVGGYFAYRNETRCSQADIWSFGGACLNNMQFLDRCSGLQMALQQQERRMQAAESNQKAACTSGASQQCASQTANFQSETSLYQVFQQRYQECQRGVPANGNRARPTILNGP